MDIEILKQKILDMAEEIYAEKEAEIGIERIRELERVILLRVVDNKWMDHIDAMDQLRQGIGLRAIGQEDPVRAYQNEGFDMFDDMIKHIQEEVMQYMFNVNIQTDAKRKQVTIISSAHKDEFHDEDRDRINQGKFKQPKEAQEPIRKEATVGRNDLCPCGSGKKYKKCCGSK